VKEMVWDASFVVGEINGWEMHGRGMESKASGLSAMREERWNGKEGSNGSAIERSFPLPSSMDQGEAGRGQAGRGEAVVGNGTGGSGVRCDKRGHGTEGTGRDGGRTSLAQAAEMSKQALQGALSMGVCGSAKVEQRAGEEERRAESGRGVVWWLASTRGISGGQRQQLGAMKGACGNAGLREVRESCERPGHARISRWIG
jgi:hypothetical protein